MTRLGKSGKITSVNADKRILIQMMSVLRFSRMSGRHKTDVCRRLVSQNHFHWTIFVSCFFVTKIQEAVFVREWFDAFPRPTNARAAGMTRAFVCGPIQNLQLESPESIGYPKFGVPKKFFLRNSCSVDRNTKMTQSNAIQLDSIPSAMDVAYLYRNTDASLGWTSTLSWKADELLGLKTCPVTGESIGMVCDGVVAVALSNDITNKECTEACEVIRFKYGKKTYQLSMANTGSNEGKTDKRPTSSVYGYGWIGMWFGIGTSRALKSPAPIQSLAQNRIATALDLATLKILHKGSVLYNSESSFLNNEEQQSTISKTILKISEDDWDNSPGSKKKATLIVMGTHSANTLKEPPKSNEGAGSGILPTVLGIPFRLVYWPCKLAFHFLLSFLGPFLPSNMLPGATDGETTNSRPHQD